ncbi:putative transcriptional regulator [Methanomicrobium sp. W14]|uniref:winged helix-turn-helix transcriptional regulator n=1 Tax=Methanomicrobium sp. W14 TaxID=2817839 RepID=UPI001AEAFD12|nr:winged helix-turn-helix transcriptional regulator [Methanomicrobium sp. W14]MBP2133952.1 putative transcriptional regulator [Methanomicrobium sp. W14]
MNFFPVKVKVLILIYLLCITILFSCHTCADDKIIQIRNGYIVTSAYNENLSGREVSDSKEVDLWNTSPQMILNTLISEKIPFFGDITITLLEIVIASGSILLLGYKSINRKNIFQNKARKEIFEIIKKNPGISFSEIVKALSITKTKAKYHMGVLVSYGAVRPFSENGHTGYFKNNDTYTISEMKMSLVQKNATDKQILEVLGSRPGITRKQLAEAMGIKGPSVSWHMKRLRDSGYIYSVKTGRNTRFYLNRSLPEPGYEEKLINCTEPLQTAAEEAGETK